MGGDQRPSRPHSDRRSSRSGRGLRPVQRHRIDLASRSDLPDESPRAVHSRRPSPTRGRRRHVVRQPARRVRAFVTEASRRGRGPSRGPPSHGQGTQREHHQIRCRGHPSDGPAPSPHRSSRAVRQLCVHGLDRRYDVRRERAPTRVSLRSGDTTRDQLSSPLDARRCRVVGQPQSLALRRERRERATACCTRSPSPATRRSETE